MGTLQKELHRYWALVSTAGPPPLPQHMAAEEIGLVVYKQLHMRITKSLLNSNVEMDMDEVRSQTESVWRLRVQLYILQFWCVILCWCVIF
jgi:hypothetical protein